MAKEQAVLVNGELAPGAGFERSRLVNHPELLISTVHIWIWRYAQRGLEVLLQKRSLTKTERPGMLDISAAGHVDTGESSIDAAVREAKEEIGLTIEKETIEFAFRLRKTNVPNCIATVYLYRVDDSFLPKFNDGEVASIEWLALPAFQELLREAERHNFSNHGKGYFTMLLERLEIAQEAATSENH